MSVGSVTVEQWRDATRRRVDAAWRLAVRVLVGDRLGLVLWLGTVSVLALYWRVGVFINDNYTLANTLVALSEGHLNVERAVFGPLDAPGMHLHDGSHYGRNYGQVAFALPFLWVLEGLTVVADPGLVFAALWSLGLLALAIQVGRLVDRPDAGAMAGAVVAAGLFVVQAVPAEPIDARLLPVAALQFSAVVATAFAAVLAYRLLWHLHDRRTGLAAGVLTVFATGVGFWASLPKRHVYVVALVLGVAYAFYRSRSPTDADALLSATGFRALAYALVGLVTWVHAGEGFVVFLALVLVDLPTAPSNDPRTLALVGAAFFVSLLPFFATNVIIAGDPLKPPRALKRFGSHDPTPGFGESLSEGGPSGGGGGGGGGGSGGGSGAGGGSTGGRSVLDAVLDPVTALLAHALAFAGEVHAEADWLLTALLAPIQAGIDQLQADPGKLWRIFVRGGYIPGVAEKDLNQTLYLTVLESAPVLAGTAALVGVGAVRARRSVGRVADRLPRSGSELRRRVTLPEGLPDRVPDRFRPPFLAPAPATDAFVLLVGALFLLTYYTRFPLHAMVTVRYLLVLFPLGVYALARVPALRRVLDRHGRLAMWSYLAGVLVGAQLFLTVVVVRSFGDGEAFQIHALVSLALAFTFAAFAVASTLTDRLDPLTAATGGLAAAAGTDFLLLSGLVYFQYGPYVLPLADYLADLLPV